jgi:hypothetical protein
MKSRYIKMSSGALNIDVCVLEGDEKRAILEDAWT